MAFLHFRVSANFPAARWDQAKEWGIGPRLPAYLLPPVTDSDSALRLWWGSLTPVGWVMELVAESAIALSAQISDHCQNLPRSAIATAAAAGLSDRSFAAVCFCRPAFDPFSDLSAARAKGRVMDLVAVFVPAFSLAPRSSS